MKSELCNLYVKLGESVKYKKKPQDCVKHKQIKTPFFSM